MGVFVRHLHVHQLHEKVAAKLMLTVVSSVLRPPCDVPREAENYDSMPAEEKSCQARAVNTRCEGSAAPLRGRPARVQGDHLQGRPPPGVGGRPARAWNLHEVWVLRGDVRSV